MLLFLADPLPLCSLSSPLSLELSTRASAAGGNGAVEEEDAPDSTYSPLRRETLCRAWSPAWIRREERQNSVHVTPCAHKPATTALYIGAGEPAQVGTLKLIQRRLLLLLVWWQANYPPLVAGRVRPRCKSAVILMHISLVVRTARGIERQRSLLLELLKV